MCMHIKTIKQKLAIQENEMNNAIVGAQHDICL